MFRRAALRLGYVPRAQLDAADEKLRQLRQRLDKTARLLAAATASADQMKKSAEQVQRIRHDDERRYEAMRLALTAAHEQRALLSRRIATLEQQLRERQADIAATDKRIAAASRELDATRDSLIGVEVKLDILEGAANVLDHRLRAARERAPERSLTPQAGRVE